MCMVSMIGDDFTSRFPIQYPNINTQQHLPKIDYKLVPAEEWDALKAEVAELKELLLAAKKYDEATGQKDCEMEEKIELLRKIGDALGISLEEVFKDE